MGRHKASDARPFIRINPKRGSMCVNRVAFCLLGEPTHILFLWGGGEQSLLIAPSTADTREAFEIPERDRKRGAELRLQRKAFVRGLALRLGWSALESAQESADSKTRLLAMHPGWSGDGGLKVYGKYDEELNMVSFKLADAEPVPRVDKADKDKAGDGNA